MDASRLRERYLSAVVAVQQKLLERDAGEQFSAILPVLGEAAGADRSYYFDCFEGDDGAHIRFRSEWTRAGVPRDDEIVDPEYLADIPAQTLIPEVIERLCRGDAVAGPPSVMPEQLSAYMHKTAVRTLLLLPIRPGGQLKGLLGFDNCTDERPWNAEEVDLLRAAAGAMAIALEREEAERRLGRLQSLLGHHIEQTPLGVIEWDEDFRVCFWSRRAESIFGWPAAEVLGKRHDEWRFVHEDDIPRVAQVVQGLLEGRTPYSICANRNYTRDGSVRHCEWYNSVVRDGSGRIRSQLSLVLDVSERVHAEEELRRAQSRAAQVEKMAALGQMASGIAHDFNNALTVILGKTELLLHRYALPERAVEKLREIETAGTDAAATVRQLQQFVRSRPGSGRRQRLDLAALAAEVVNLTRGRWFDEALRSGATIAINTDQLRETPVVTDASAVRELLTNLIFNAVDAMPLGGTLSLATGEQEGRAFLRVADTGAGMTPETLSRCCEPFFTTRGVAGTGLGLTVCWSIARRLRGELAIESEFGRGTTVTLWLPACDPNAESDPEPDQPALPPAPPMHALVIDDRLGVIRTIQELLTQLGHTCNAVNSGSAGLALLAGIPFDVVITDLGMPGMDGRTVAEEAKRIRPGIPVILMTGWAEELLDAGSPIPGVDRIIGKPLTIEQLATALAEVGGRREG